MTGWPAKLRTYRKLGLANLWRVGSYRLGLKQGWHPVLKIQGELPQGPFFRRPEADLPFDPRRDWQTTMPWFGWTEKPLDGTPDWHRSIETGAMAPGERQWHQLPDFDPQLGDIKAVWEASRLDWLVAMATRGETDRIDRWLEDWLVRNPPYRGVNWKCGQEASIRVMHMALAAVILGQDARPEQGLAKLLKLHLKRIVPTIKYAIGQTNNHGTSEAAALFIGGSWLDRLGDSDGADWARKGRQWLEERANTLILEDGTFSQYSLVYHRVMLDTYCLAELWRRRHGMAAFSARLGRRLAAATVWLQQMVQTDGDGPNFGANDGTRLIALTDGPYRDFRPTMQSSAILFCERLAVEPLGPWDRLTRLFRVDRPRQTLKSPATMQFVHGGLTVLRMGGATVYFRTGRFEFRPGQADLMHVDLWVDGRNLLRDDGSYSYADMEQQFGSVAMHNSIMFDEREPMPRLSRFLWGEWVEADLSPVCQADNKQRVYAVQNDAQGMIHSRSLRLRQGSLRCHDQYSGPARHAVLRWRLPHSNWQLANGIAEGEGCSLAISGSSITDMRLSRGVESRHYFQKEAITVLEVHASVPGSIVTEVSF